MPGTFPSKILDVISKAQVVGIKIGKKPHRVIAVWVVVAKNRVFVRSWSLKSEGWYRTTLREPRGSLHLSNRSIRIRTVRTRSEKLRDAVTLAYKQKYNTPGSIRYVKDLSGKQSRETTTELIPLR